jgi:hypothetical protein
MGSSLWLELLLVRHGEPLPVLSELNGGLAVRLTLPVTAAPQVAGIAAYFLSLDAYSKRLQVPGSVAQNVKDLIVELSYARVNGGPPVIWNGNILVD